MLQTTMNLYAGWKVPTSRESSPGVSIWDPSRTLRHIAELGAGAQTFERELIKNPFGIIPSLYLDVLGKYLLQILLFRPLSPTARWFFWQPQFNYFHFLPQNAEETRIVGGRLSYHFRAGCKEMLPQARCKVRPQLAIFLCLFSSFKENCLSFPNKPGV